MEKYYNASLNRLVMSIESINKYKCLKNINRNINRNTKENKKYKYK